MSRLLWALLPLAACVPTEVPTGRPVNETGYLDVDQIHYSADAPLSSLQTVTLLGLPGALLPGEGVLSIDNATASIVQPDASGAFRVTLDVMAGDEHVFTYTPSGEPEGATSFLFEDDLTGLATPAPGSEVLFEDPGTGGITVFPSRLAQGDPPFLLYNADRPSPAVESAGEPVQLDIVSGETLCIFSIANGNTSPQVCLVL